MPDSPPRVLPLAGATNFRDLGGYRGRDDRPVRWRRLFRSDHLGALTAADHALLADIGLGAAFDFRGIDERAAAPYEVPGLAQHALPIEPTVAQRMQEMVDDGRELTVPAVEGLMRDLYRSLVGERAPRFAEFFVHLLRADAPIVFHCTAGKDRTGVAAALVLLALGVPHDVVMQDYLLTNDVFKPPWAPRPGLAPGVTQALWGVQPSYLQAALDVVDREFGGPQTYLREVIGLDTERMRALEQRYLQPG
ncbi:MAG: tyrosine-protein phosphatase [Rubrivivax sp.]|nr:tyrosine-protein phosphatase [Rubrivivax sp.]